MTQTQVANIANIVAQVMAANALADAPKGKAKVAAKPGKASDEDRAAYDAKVVKAFEKAGFKNNVPRETILVYGREKDDGTKTGWLAKGRKPKEKQKSIRVNYAPGRGFNLFHLDQTEAVQ